MDRKVIGICWNCSMKVVVERQVWLERERGREKDLRFVYQS